MKLKTSFFITLWFSFIGVSSCYWNLDWDWMDCHHGNYFSNATPRADHCICEEGWTGVDCSLCGTSAVCSTGQICDKTFGIGEYKAFSCTPIAGGIIPAEGSITSQWTFDSSGVGSGVVSVFVYPSGAPFLFNCSFNDCTKQVGTTSETIKCGFSSCHCSSWCNSIVSGIIQRMKTSALFTCDFTSDSCVIEQNELPIVINLQCYAASCQQGPYVPPTSEFTLLSIVIMSTSGVVLLGVLSGVSICVYITISRKRENKYSPIYSFPDQVEISLSWNDLSCKIKKRIVLNSISGIALPGQITAILGPSGAGKTTFLDMLAGRKNTGSMSGNILVNGQKRDKFWKRISGYVLQDDRMMGTLTVREHLEFIAQMRLPSSMPYSLKMKKVSEILEDLGISHISNSQIGTNSTRGISGGERRRLAIASELITDPSILFLDEPTSGLDSYTAFCLMDTLKKLAVNKKRTVIVSIHQPNSNIYQLFDALMLLSCGELVYFGSTQEVLPYFSGLGYDCPQNFNPADYLIDVVNKTSDTAIRVLSQKYRDSDISRSIATTLYNIQSSPPFFLNEEFSREYASSFVRQVALLAGRTTKNNLRNFFLIPAQYSLTIALALLMGGIFFNLTLDLAGVQNRAGCLFFSIALLSFGSLASIDTFFHERDLFLRERSNGMYRTSAYFTAKTLCDVIPMRIVPPILLGGITYYMVGLRPGLSHFLWYLLALVLVSLVAGALCLAIGSAIPSVGVGNLVAILILLFYLLFAGFLLNKNNIPEVVRWVSFSSFLGYGFEILMVNELQFVEVFFNPADVPSSTWQMVNGNIFLAQFGMDPNQFYTDFMILAVMLGFYFVVAYILLRWGTKERR